ncbi:MAG TPA: hypothetical protein VGE38_06650 [Nocardioides sp.]|uniref:hypothetical protein n=1 Tax=Nocardioides sp. TaxID=35761 RepID=UPI002ED7A4B1
MDVVVRTDGDRGVTDSPTRPPAHRTARWGVLGVLVALIAGSLLTLGYLGADRGGNPFSSRDEEQAQRERVMSQARQFMLRVNTYGPDLLEGEQMPTYRKLVSEVVTAKFAADFEQNVPYAEATVAQAGVARITEVYAVGVADLDLDAGTATALVAGSFTNSFTDPKDAGQRVNAEPQPYRVEVELVRQRGTWKVDDFSPVGAEGQQQAPSAPAPSPSVEGGAQ